LVSIICLLIHNHGIYSENGKLSVGDYGIDSRGTRPLDIQRHVLQASNRRRRQMHTFQVSGQSEVDFRLSTYYSVRDGNSLWVVNRQPLTKLVLCCFYMGTVCLYCRSSVVNQSSQLRVVFPKVSVENCIFPEMFLSQTKPLIDRCAGGPLQLLQSILELWKTHLNAESTISRELSHPGLAALNVTYSEATFASKSFIKFSAGKRPELFICVPSAYPHASVDQYMVKVPQSGAQFLCFACHNF
jgi:hypothetical protein